MKIAVAADSHENYHHLAWFLNTCKEQDITECIFLGDAINPGFVKELAGGFDKLYWVFGNNDGDHVKITKILTEHSHHVADDCYDEISIDGHAVFITHYPTLGKNAAKTGDYRASFYGHNHQKHEERVGETLLVNPGELSGHLTGTVSFYVYDTQSNSGEHHINSEPRIARER